MRRFRLRQPGGKTPFVRSTMKMKQRCRGGCHIRHRMFARLAPCARDAGSTVKRHLPRASASSGWRSAGEVADEWTSSAHFVQRVWWPSTARAAHRIAPQGFTRRSRDKRGQPELQLAGRDVADVGKTPAADWPPPPHAPRTLAYKALAAQAAVHCVQSATRPKIARRIPGATPSLRRPARPHASHSRRHRPPLLWSSPPRRAIGAAIRAGRLGRRPRSIRGRNRIVSWTSGKDTTGS